MKRREFLALLSSVGITAALGELAGGPAGVAAEEAGSLSAWPRRQGVGYPVRVHLDLSRVPTRGKLPELVAIREGQLNWSCPVDTGSARVEIPGRSWSLEWLPPIVRPSEHEMTAELIRFRLVAIDDFGRALGPVSGPVEVVCGQRGWGC